DCGEAKTYKEQELKVREGDPSSRIVHYIPPPEPACWTGTDAPPGSPAPTGQAAASADSVTPAASAAASASEPSVTPAASSSASATSPPPQPSTLP
ncbi:MAG: hypothetical protein VB934_03470, partial [Polyangiaceae bacterium]